MPELPDQAFPDLRVRDLFFEDAFGPRRKQAVLGCIAEMLGSLARHGVQTARGAIRDVGVDEDICADGCTEALAYGRKQMTRPAMAYDLHRGCRLGLGNALSYGFDVALSVRRTAPFAPGYPGRSLTLIFEIVGDGHPCIGATGAIYQDVERIIAHQQTPPARLLEGILRDVSWVGALVCHLCPRHPPHRLRVAHVQVRRMHPLSTSFLTFSFVTPDRTQS